VRQVGHLQKNFVVVVRLTKPKLRRWSTIPFFRLRTFYSKHS